MHDRLNAWNLQEYKEAEINRLTLELKQTMDLYNAACKEALLAKQKVVNFPKES